jgi:CubicO group peptidase (beta-lactamase class C family)
MTRLRLFLTIATALCALSACVIQHQDESAAEEALYMERYNDFFEAGAIGLEAYAPLGHVTGADPVSPLTVADDPSLDPAAIEAAIEYARATKSSSLLIWHSGALVSETYFGDHDRGSLLVSRSLAKPVAAVALGRAIAEGDIESLDQPVADFFHEWESDNRKDILVRHLLDMRSGLLPQGFATEADDLVNRTYMHPRHDELIINEYPLVNDPGTRYEYANASAELVAPLIERATGVQYEDWVGQQVLQPIGAPGGEVWMNREGGTAHSGCCIMLPAESFLRIAVLLLQDGKWDGIRLLPDGFVAEMGTPTPQNPHAGMGVYVAGDYIERRGAMNPDSNIGRNWHSEPYLADDLFLFDGNGHQVGYIIPSADLVILRTGVGPDEGLEWDNARLPNLLIRGLQISDQLSLTPQPYALNDEQMTVAAPDGREIPVRVLAPANCATCPTMIFSHGAFSTFDRYDALLMPLARTGFRIVAPNHVDSEEHPDRDSYGSSDTMQKRLEDYQVLADAFPAETSFAIGHSYGALIAQLAGGARLDGQPQTPVMDSRFRPAAVIAISPPGPVPQSISETGWAEIKTPMLVVTGTTDILPGFIDNWRLHLTSYEASLNPDTYALIYSDMDHYMNGAYGRQTNATGDAMSTRTAVMDHLVGSIRWFTRAAAQDSPPAAESWTSLDSAMVEARMKE